MDTKEIIELLPKNLVSRIAGKVALMRFPRTVLQGFLAWYVNKYGVDMTESQKGLESFDSFDSFFRRSLHSKARQIDVNPLKVVSPVDGKVYSVNTIKDGTIMQVKDVYYQLSDLIGENHADYYEGGTCMTLYLSPGDYHRIHAPYALRLKSVSYFPGNLWPVNNEFLNTIMGLFAVNERIFAEFFGYKNRKIGIVKVGAMVVGKINTRYAPFTSNDNLPKILDWEPDEKIGFKKGEEIGDFALGSTVILVFPKNCVKPLVEEFGTLVRVGQPIADFVN